MNRTLKVVFATLLTLGGLVGATVFLTGQGLDRAEKWVSLVGVFVSVAVGVAGLILAWLTWRQPAAGAGPRTVRVRRTGNATATGPGSRANTGLTGTTAAADLNRTGAAKATDGGWANTGEADDPPRCQQGEQNPRLSPGP